MLDGGKLQFTKRAFDVAGIEPCQHHTYLNRPVGQVILQSLASLLIWCGGLSLQVVGVVVLLQVVGVVVSLQVVGVVVSLPGG